MIVPLTVASMSGECGAVTKNEATRKGSREGSSKSARKGSSSAKRRGALLAAIARSYDQYPVVTAFGELFWFDSPEISRSNEPKFSQPANDYEACFWAKKSRSESVVAANCWFLFIY